MQLSTPKANPKSSQSIVDLTKIIDADFKSKMNVSKIEYGYIFVNVAALVLLAIILTIIALAAGTVFPLLDAPSQILGMIALIAIAVSFFEVASKGETVLSEDARLRRIIDWNFKNIVKTHSIQDDRKTDLRALLKMKIIEMDLPLSDIIVNLTDDEKKWALWLYNALSGKELLK